MTAIWLIASTMAIAFVQSAFAVQTTPVPEVGAPAEEILQSAAGQMLELQSYRFKVIYEEGKTTVYSRIKVSKIEGAVVRPDRMSAKAEARLGFVGIDFNATIIGQKVSVDAVGVGGDVGISDDVALVLKDPTSLIVDAAIAVQNPVISRYSEDEELGDLVWISGIFNPALLAGSPLGNVLGDPGPRAVEIAIDSVGRIVSVRLEGPIISYDSDNVVRRIEFFDFNEAIEIN
jgi:hypothetical protein